MKFSNFDKKVSGIPVPVIFVPWKPFINSCPPKSTRPASTTHHIPSSSIHLWEAQILPCARTFIFLTHFNTCVLHSLFFIIKPANAQIILNISI